MYARLSVASLTWHLGGLMRKQLLSVMVGGTLFALAGCSSGTTDLSNSVASLQSEVDSLKSAMPAPGAVDSLSSAVSSIGTQLDAVPTSIASAPTVSPTAASSSASAAGSDGTVVHTGPLNMGEYINQNADLDSTSSDWSTSGNGAADISYVSQRVLIPNSTALLGSAAADGTPELVTCQNVDYAVGQVPIDNLKQGQVVCVKTNEGRYSVLQFVNRDLNGVHFSATTYGP